MTLNQLKKKGRGKIISILGSDLKNQLLRLGLEEGDCIRGIHKIFGGPIIIQFRNQELALGEKLASQIEITSA